jgi:hypothetical protein
VLALELVEAGLKILRREEDDRLNAGVAIRRSTSRTWPLAAVNVKVCQAR